MKIEKIHIKNLKGLTDVQVGLSKSRKSKTSEINLLYGANGVGKTTLLEAISLIGHVTTMSRLPVIEDETAPKLRNSALREAVGNDSKMACVEVSKNGNASNNVWGVLRNSLIGGIENWWEGIATDQDERSDYVKRDSSIQFEVAFAGKRLEFWVCFRQGSGESITNILSSKYDDLEMDAYLALIYRERDADLVDEMVDHLISVRSHWIKGKTGNGIFQDKSLIERGILGKADRNISPENKLGLVSYINTDLNNFGRGNDIRESVKNFREDFYEECCRLNIDISSNSQLTPAHVKKLKLLNKALEEFQFEVVELYSIKDETRIKIKKPGFPLTTIDSLSSGENEAFMLFLLFIWTIVDGSVVLLDEPDLHISMGARKGFFQSMFRIAKDKQWQLVISTHNGIATLTENRVKQYYLKREIINSKVIYSVKWDDEEMKLVAENNLIEAYISLCAINSRSSWFIKLLLRFWKWYGVMLKESTIAWRFFFYTFCLFFLLFPFMLNVLLQRLIPGKVDFIMGAIVVGWLALLLLVIFFEIARFMLHLIKFRRG